MSLRYLSLFSGLEAAHVATAPLGWQCVGVSEIDPNACRILAHRLPGVPNLGSVTEITDEQIASLGRIDVVIGGSPCQDLSVAGKRAGLGGARSSLFHEQLRIFNAARAFCGARWCLWENVPGAFSSNSGRDFAVVVGELAGCVLDVPEDGWGSEGVALGDNGLCEWAVLDSQWFGVAQRRRRVFAVLDAGNWTDRAPVLLEPESLRGDSAPRRETGKGIAGSAGAGVDGGGVQEVAQTLLKGGNSNNPLDLPLIACLAHGQGGAEVTTGQRSPTLTCNHEAPIIAFDTTQITSKANGSQPKAGDPCHPLAAHAHAPAIAFSPKAAGAQTTLGYDLESGTAPTLSVGQTPAVHHATAVRRLTPRECERLQALPDDWTLVPGANGKPMADGPRYKALGNTFTATVIRWIAERITGAHLASQQVAP